MKEKIGGIYAIIHKESQKPYIGSALDARHRWSEHKVLLRGNKHYNAHLQAAWNLYGEEAFEFKILERVYEPTNLLWREQFYIDYYQSYKSDKGFNIRRKADSNLGLPAWNKGIPCPDYVKDAISKANTGRIFSEETKQIWKEQREGHPGYMTGKSHNQETRKQMSTTHQDLEPKEFICLVCEVKFLSGCYKAKYCSILCRNAATNVIARKIRQQGQNVETRELQSKAKMGHLVSEETRKILSDLIKNAPFRDCVCTWCGNVFQSNRHATPKYCSKNCAASFYRQQKKLKIALDK